MPRYVDCASGGDKDKHFVNKPSKGSQHSDQLIVNDGVTFNVRYIGCLEIKTSMKMLDFTMRSQVAKECINRVCEVASLMTPKKRRVDKRIEMCISETPIMDNTGTDVALTVCSKYLMLTNLETNEVMAKHDMPRISFASGGDPDALDFVAFVAKSLDEWRACYVLECGGGLAQNLISTIGQAFDLRYNEFFVKSQDLENLNSDKDYYNDLPGKLPPDLIESKKAIATGSISVSVQKKQKQRDRLSSNLIDLNSPPPDHDYVNEKHIPEANSNGQSSASSGAASRDVFDMQPISGSFSLSAEVQRSQLMTESWFHGVISRPAAESMLHHDGEFLVRESKSKPGQYVLTGLKASTPKHLLLIDPEGVVRTKDQVFDNISHLINYHWTNALPIIFEESALVLRHPVARPRDAARQ